MALHAAQHVVLFSKETVYGTPVTPEKDLGLRQNLTLNADQNARQLPTTGQANAPQTTAGKADIKGSMELIMQHGRPLELIFGSVAHQLTTSDTEHTFTVADTLPSITLEDAYELGATDVASIYNGVKFTSMTFGLALDGSLTCRGDWTAKDVVNGTAADVDVLSTLVPLQDFHGAFKTGTQGGETAVAETQNMEVTLNRNSKKLWGLGSRSPTSADGMLLEASFKGTVGFATNSEFARLLGGVSIGAIADTPSGVVFQATNGVTLGSGKRELLLTFTDCHYTNFTKTTQVGDWVLADISGIGLASATGCKYTDNIIAASF